MPFKPGHDPNRNTKGRPIGSGDISITAMVKRKLKEIPHKSHISYAEQVVEKILEKAIKEGDNTMLKQLWQYIDGMPKQDVGLVTSDNKPIPFLNLNINAFQSNLSNKQNNRIKAENQSSSGGDISQQDNIDIDVSDRASETGQESDTN